MQVIQKLIWNSQYYLNIEQIDLLFCSNILSLNQWIYFYSISYKTSDQSDNKISALFDICLINCDGNVCLMYQFKIITWNIFLFSSFFLCRSTKSVSLKYQNEIQTKTFILFGSALEDILIV
jgi:hypothetical protein